jgi:ABC-2 type transport system permease protein
MQWHRTSAIVERELRKFIRTPALLVMAFVMPMLQLFVLGNAFGGRVTKLTVAVVDEDGGPAARRVREALYALQSNGDVIRPLLYASEREAAEDVRTGKVQGGIVIPAQFSRRVYAHQEAKVGLLLDNTDNFVSATVRALATGAVQSAAPERHVPRMTASLGVAAVELYPYVPYMRYMLPGVISLGIFMSVMMGGGIVYLDDKQRGVHEGYLVTPITKLELVLGQNIAGTIKAAVGGVIIAVVGALSAGATDVFQPGRFLGLLALILVTSFAFMSMVACFVARMNSPILPRVLFGMLNTLLYFPSGAVYPVQALPSWLRVISRVDPFTYAVHGLRVLLLKGVSASVVLPDVFFLALFSSIMFVGAVTLFRRTL